MHLRIIVVMSPCRALCGTSWLCACMSMAVVEGDVPNALWGCGLLCGWPCSGLHMLQPACLSPLCQLWEHSHQPLVSCLFSFKRVHYTIEALFPPQDYGPLAPPTEALRSLEEQLVNKKEALQHFETEYMQVGRPCLHCCLSG